MNKTKINWTDMVWNPVTGCTKVSAGCKNCYAETIANRFWGDRKFTDVMIHPERLDQPLKWKKPKKIFVNSMSDLFHETILGQDIINILSVMEDAKQHTFQVLTKRPARMKAIVDFYHSVIPNVWFGVSIEDQKTADDRIPLLCYTPAVIKWLSAEPLLGYIDLQLRGRNYGISSKHEYIDWVVVGCESGPKRRECKIEWVESIVEQCKYENVPVWVKQLEVDGKVTEDVEKFPEHLRIREMPYETVKQ